MVRKHLSVLIIAVGLLACTTTKSDRDTSGEAESADAPHFLDWLPLEARLSDLATPIDAVTRDQVVALKIALQEREHELGEWIVPLFNSYLPRGRRLQGRVVFELGRPTPVEVTPHGIAYIDVTFPEWKTDQERLWSEVIGALYRCALTQVLPNQTDEPIDAETFANKLLRQLMVDGLATHVIAQGAPLARDATPDAYLMLRDEKAERFQRLEAIMATARTASPPEIQSLWRKTLEDEPKDRLLGVAGAAMAAAIEERTSRASLMDTVSLGQRAFYDAYNEGRPGALVSFRLPPDAVAPVEELPPLPGLGDDAAH